MIHLLGCSDYVVNYSTWAPGCSDYVGNYSTWALGGKKKEERKKKKETKKGKEEKKKRKQRKERTWRKNEYVSRGSLFRGNSFRGAHWCWRPEHCVRFRLVGREMLGQSWMLVWLKASNILLFWVGGSGRSPVSYLVNNSTWALWCSKAAWGRFSGFREKFVFHFLHFQGQSSENGYGFGGWSVDGFLKVLPA